MLVRNRASGAHEIEIVFRSTRVHAETQRMTVGLERVSGGQDDEYIYFDGLTFPIAPHMPE